MVGAWLANVFGREPVEGHLDTIEDGRVFGWARDRAKPGRRLLVDLFVDDVFVGEVLANVRRNDLLAAGIGDGCHGFEFDLKQTAFAGARRVEAYAIGDRRTQLHSNAGPRKPAMAASMELRSYLQITFAGMLAAPCAPIETPSAREGSNLTPLYERLFEHDQRTARPFGHGRQLGRYLDFIRLRNPEAFGFETALASAQYEAFLIWYLEGYARKRGRMRAPLGAQDIAFLNDRVGGKPIGAQPASRARALFSSRFGPIGAAETDGLLGSTIWNAFELPCLSLEDCLAEAVSELRAIEEGDDSAGFPLSNFMARWRRLNPILLRAPIETSEDRIFIYLAYFLFAAVAPHLLAFVSDRWLEAFLDMQDSADSPLQRYCERVFGKGPDYDARWRYLVASQGYTLSRREYATRTAAGNRLFAAARRLDDRPIVDVQVIGPFTRAHGVGESCRNLAKALERLDYSLCFCDSTLDHPNASIDSGGVQLRPLGPARVNIVHLTLEEAPKIFAYEADAFTGAYNVLFPYVELAPPIDTQRLALSLADEVWAATGFIERTLSPFVRTARVGNCCKALPARDRDAARGDDLYRNLAGPDDFVFLTASDALSGVFRKNPLGVVRAFLDAFPSDRNVRLVVKTHSLERVTSSYERAIWQIIRDVSREDRRIALLDEHLDVQAHATLLAGADCLVSLHRSEGLGLHILEAMRLGVPTIVTAYSGSEDFCTPRTSFLIDYDLVHVDPRHYPFATPEQVWAAPRHATAVSCMRRVRADGLARENTASRALALVGSLYSVDAFAENIGRQLARILGHPPHRHISIKN